MAVRSSSLLAGTVPDPVSRIRCLGDRWWVQEQTESQGVLNQGGGLVRKWRGLLENRGLIPAEIKYFRGDLLQICLLCWLPKRRWCSR